jgi:hypothetical protein
MPKLTPVPAAVCSQIAHRYGKDVVIVLALSGAEVSSVATGYGTTPAHQRVADRLIRILRETATLSPEELTHVKLEDVPKALVAEFERGYVPADCPPGLEEHAYRAWKESGGKPTAAANRPAARTLTREYVEGLLRKAGGAINANNGRCALIEEALCGTTSLCCYFLDLFDGTAKDKDMAAEKEKLDALRTAAAEALPLLESVLGARAHCEKLRAALAKAST